MLLSPFSHRPTVAALLLAFVTGAAAAPPEQSASQPLKHRDRAVTESDFQRLAPDQPGADVKRAAPPKPMAAPKRERKSLRPPVIDDRRYQQVRDDLNKKTPAHTPEWSNPQQGDPGAHQLDPETGTVKFGDGRHGKRLPTGQSNVTPTYRHGAGKSGNTPAGPVPVPYPNSAESQNSKSTNDSDDSDDSDDD